MRKLLLATVLTVGGLASAAFLRGPAQTHAADDSDQHITAAPIESVEVTASGATPTGHALKIKAGLPGGCVEPYKSDFVRFGDYILVWVLNTQPAGDVACTKIYGTYDVTIDLGTSFVPGHEYTAHVNGTTKTFVANGGIVPPPPSSGDRVVVDAPIDALEIVTLESFPPQYSAHIRAGLPSGCAEQGTHDVVRDGNVVTIHVTNTMPNGNPICTMIYGTYELNVNLGSDFVSGQTYTVNVNDKQVTFTAQ